MIISFFGNWVLKCTIKKVLLLFLNKFMHALIMATLKRRLSHPIQ